MLLTSCGVSFKVDYGEMDEIASNNSNIIANREHSDTIQKIEPTPTPFMPIPPTPTPIPTQTPKPSPTTVQDASGPNENQIKATASFPIEDYEKYPAPSNLTNILLLGSDIRPERDSTFRTDVMLLITINTIAESVTITSFPRDIWVLLPNYGEQRMNSAFYIGGWDMIAATFEYNFGVHPDYYAMVDFSSFIDLIDVIQGIDVTVEQKLTDQRDGHGTFTVKPGVVHMDGETALWYVRSRKTTSDIDRGRRQQEVIQGFFQTLISIDALSNAKEAYNVLSKSLVTNLKFADVAPLLPFAYTIYQTKNIERHTIDYRYVSDMMTYDGRMVLWPDLYGIRNLMQSIQNQK